MPITNSKDVLFKSKVNNYINEKVGTTTFAVTDEGDGNYTVGKSNGDVTLTIDEQNETYIFTPTRGEIVTIPLVDITSIVVDFITLNADVITLEDMAIAGSGIVNFGDFSTPPSQNMYTISPAVLMADIVGATEDEPFFLYPNDIGYPTAGRIITITSGEVMLEENSNNTSIIVNDDATFILRAEQASEVTINGDGSSVILGSIESQSTSISVNTKGTNHITGGMGADTIELGSGTDILYYALGDENYFSDSSISECDTIKNFSVIIDKMSLLSRVGTSLIPPSSLERFEDMEGDSITSEQDIKDKVFKSTSFLALEENKAGIVVVDSGTYAGAYLYVNDDIAELDESSDLFIKMLDTTDLDAVGTLNVSDYFVEAEEIFKVTNIDSVVHFAGTANGNISLSIDSNTVTFTKGSVTAKTTVDLGDIERIHLDSWQTIVGSAADLTKLIGGSGNVIVTGSAGDQTLYILTEGTNSITAGAGSDTIWIGDSTANMGQDTIIIASGDSTATETDKIYFFELGVGKDILSLPSAIVAGNITLGTEISGEDITVGGVTIGQMIISDGIATFQDADDTTAVSINSTDALTAAVTYLSNEVIDGNTVAFEYDLGEGTEGTYIFQGNASEDIVVNLVGITSITNLNTDVIISEIIL